MGNFAFSRYLLDCKEEREAGRALRPRGEERKTRKSRQRCLDRSTDGSVEGKASGEFRSKVTQQRRPLPLLILDPSCRSVLLCAGFWAADVHAITYLWGIRARLLTVATRTLRKSCRLSRRSGQCLVLWLGSVLHVRA